MKSKTTLEYLIKNISKEEFENFYFSHSKKETMKKYNIGSYVWYKYLDYYSIKKPNTKINELRELTNEKTYGVKNQFQRVEYIQDSYVKKNGSMENHYKKAVESQKKSNLEKYGVEFTLQLPSVINKRKETIESIPDFYKNIVAKTKQTKLEKYGDENYHNIEQMKQTNMERYGVEYNFASDDPKLNGRSSQIENWGRDNFNNREQAIKTCLERYGEDYYIKQVKLMLDELYKVGKESKPNKMFASYLLDKGILFEKEFRLGEYIYDFKLGNYLIEINPWATHNSSFSLFKSEPKSKEYHRDKTLNALNDGYTCVHIFDWTNIDAVVYGIMNKSLKIIDTYSPVKHLYDTKLKVLTNKENEDTVIIYDDGFEVIY